MIDVVIPVYKPGDELKKLLDLLMEQSIQPNKIILMNTEKQYWDIWVKKHPEFDKCDCIEIHYLEKKDFDHGNTRNQGISYSDAEYVLLMTQDAVPKDTYVIEHLLSAFQKENIAVAYARQLPKDDCREAEKFTRSFNYPASSCEKGKEDLDTLGIKTFFCSNVCAMYRRDIFDNMGGFTKKTIFNEDMIYAGNAVKAGYKIAYVSKAEVIHSHNYGNMEQFHRNFDLGVSQKEHPEVFEGIPSESEGIRLVKKTIAYLWKNGYKRQIFPMLIQSGFKFIGYRLGKNYTRLSKHFVTQCSMNKTYWQ